MAEIAYELNPKARGSRAKPRDSRRTRTAAPRFVAGAIGPTNRTASISPDVCNPELPRRHLRRAAHRLCRAGPRPARRRRRCASDRDDLRHAQRQGRDLRHRRSHGSARHQRAGDDLGHHHRPVRAAFCPGRRRKRSGIRSRTRRRLDRAELRARRQGDARAHRRTGRVADTLDLRLSKCRPAQRIRRLRRRARRSWRR